ncbi:unnamed protein product [Vicia faba]|uniref:protein-serine/threonine phosphatase n=1 Tax=Vicia faba TaxID=3906 RepID=A0AAV0Z8U5_VICFA|nr:unnamed protein product [Vicia faba]
MGIYLSAPKTEKASEDAHPYLDESTSYFGVYDGHGGKAVSKFCAKFLHQQVLRHEAYLAGDIATSLQKSFLRMDEMMHGQRGWRELAVLGDKMEKFSGMLEGFIWSPKSSEANDRADEWAFEEGPHSDFGGPNSGSTACVAVIRGNKLVVANAGDSRCVLSRKGQAHNLFKDHKPDLELDKNTTELGLPLYDGGDAADLFYDCVFADVAKEKGAVELEKEEPAKLLKDVLEKMAEQLELNPVYQDFA